MSETIVYQFEIDKCFEILSNDISLNEELFKYGLRREMSSIYVDEETTTYEITKLLMENREYINNTDIETLIGNRFLFDTIGELFEKTSLPDSAYHHIFYSFKYSYVKNFFNNNYRNFIPEYDFEQIQDKPKLKLFFSSLMSEMDKFSAIIDSLGDINDIDRTPEVYINYLAQLVGYEREDNILLSEGSFRELIKNIVEIYRIKGTNYAFELFLNFLGFNVEILEFWFDRRFYYKADNKNSYTGETERDSYKFYLTPHKPTDFVENDFSTSYSIMDSDLCEQRNLLMFDKYIETSMATPAQLLGIDPGFSGDTFTFFKTNCIAYNVGKIKKTDITLDEVSSADLLILKKYVDFLTPIFIIKNVVITIEPFEDSMTDIFSKLVGGDNVVLSSELGGVKSTTSIQEYFYDVKSVKSYVKLAEFSDLVKGDGLWLYYDRASQGIPANYPETLICGNIKIEKDVLCKIETSSEFNNLSGVWILFNIRNSWLVEYLSTGILRICKSALSTDFYTNSEALLLLDINTEIQNHGETLDNILDIFYESYLFNIHLVPNYYLSLPKSKIKISDMYNKRLKISMSDLKKSVDGLYNVYEYKNVLVKEQYKNRHMQEFVEVKIMKKI